MKLHHLKAIIDSLIEAHGDELDVRFLHQYASGRTKIGAITTYRVRPSGGGMNGSVRFNIDHPRGEEE